MPARNVRQNYASGDCEIDPARRELRILGAPVPLGGRAFEIIQLLAEAGGELVSKDLLMDRIWPDAIVLENTLHVHTAAIRKALGSHRGLLKTESGRGYRLFGTWTIRRGDAPTPPVGLRQIPASGQSPNTNLPAILTHIVGRSASVQQVADLLSAYRVVTLTGPGGIGKTALAIKVAHQILGEFSDGGWLVELASLSDPDLVPSAVARALGLRLGGDAITAEAVARMVGGQRLLLVLDNCEHVVDAVANLAEMFVRLCPRTTILATSREMFRIDGECVYRVPSLGVPGPTLAEVERILDHSAVELFVAKTQELGADFASRADTLRTIATICRQLDGIPLAIEFAAARAAALGIEPVATGLRDRFALLTSGRRIVVPRHRTLRAVLDWSYDLLPELEQRLLRHMAVFPAGFTIAAAAAVMRGSGLAEAAVAEGIANLVAKSLVALDQSESSTRWYLLETTRSYALEKLAQHDEADHAAGCHAAYFRDFFASPVAGFKSRVSTEDLTRHSREIDNVRAALDWSFSPGGDPEIGIDLTAAYAPVWMHLSLMAECCQRCELALRHLEADPPSNAWPQIWLRIAFGSTLVTTMGPPDRAHAVLATALGIAVAVDDLDAQARALSILVGVHVYRGEYGAAWIAAERLRQVADHIGEPNIAIIADRALGTSLVTAGRPHEAQQCLERVLRSPVVLDDQRRSTWHHSEHRAMARAMLARALWIQGFADQALAEAQCSLDELQGTDHQLSLCRVLYYGLGRITPMTGDFDAAERAIRHLADLAANLNASFWITAARFLEGKRLVESLAFAPALQVLREAFDTCRRTGWRLSYPEFKGTLAAALAGVGQMGEALEAVDDAIASAGQREDGQIWYVPELLRIKGEILLQQGADRIISVEECFGQAAEMAREQHALFWELRVALSFARLRVTQGRRDAARHGLAAVYDRFSEGFATADLRAARAMLDALPAA